MTLISAMASLLNLIISGGKAEARQVFCGAGAGRKRGESERPGPSVLSRSRTSQSDCRELGEDLLAHRGWRRDGIQQCCGAARQRAGEAAAGTADGREGLGGRWSRPEQPWPERHRLGTPGLRVEARYRSV